jgi:sugar (pentulose or hexulose) kinase
MTARPAPPSPGLAVGVDLGSSGLRLSIVDASGEPCFAHGLPYSRAFSDPRGWRESLLTLMASVPSELRRRIGAIALDGTSGTLLACRSSGEPLTAALPYHQACPEQLPRLGELLPPGSVASSASSSAARALRLLEQQPAEEPFLLRHQADWMMGWLLGDWRWGEEGNNLRLGWDLMTGTWAGSLSEQTWSPALPQVVPSGTVLGALDPAVAAVLDLPPACEVVAGTTDANAAVLAADPGEGDGIAVLGTTLVVKQFTPAPILARGVSCHRVAGRWLAGGASNAGAGVLARFFSDEQIRHLSRQIDPARPSGLALRPLPATGERFPDDDPDLEPILGPRPVSDALFLQALLEGLATIEARGWARLRALGAPPLERVISLGGGAANPQWRQLRQQAIGVPVLTRPGLAPALGTARLALEGVKRRTQARG